MGALLAFVFGTVGGAAMLWFALRAGRQREADARRQLEAQVASGEAELNYAEQRLALRGEQLKRTERQRDDYAQVASNRKLAPPRWERGQWVRKVWKDRRFNGHPSRNLEGLRADFADFGEQYVLVRLDIELMGGWKALLGGEHKPAVGEITQPLSAGQALIFEGPAPRVLEQLSTYLTDDDTGFMQAEDGGEKVWRDADSPMTWRFTVDVLEGYEPPQPQVVEVIKVQREIEERIVERPVVRTVPQAITDKLCNHTPEQIVTLIEAVLEVREVGRDDQLNKALAGLTPPALAAGETKASAPQ